MSYYDRHRLERLIYQNNYNKLVDKNKKREYNMIYYMTVRRPQMYPHLVTNIRHHLKYNIPQIIEIIEPFLSADDF